MGYSVFCSSVIRRTKARVAFHPLCGDRVEGSTQFNAERWRIAAECGYRGWAVWAESDMLCRADIAELVWAADPRYAVMVAKHDYRTKFPVKFLGAANPDYPRKNWSSLQLINCEHPAWRRLEEADYSLADRHRFRFMEDEEVGALGLEWNWLVSEYSHNPEARIAHFTIGLPCWAEYRDCDYAAEWFAERDEMQGCRVYSQRNALCA